MLVTVFIFRALDPITVPSPEVTFTGSFGRTGSYTFQPSRRKRQASPSFPERAFLRSPSLIARTHYGAVGSDTLAQTQIESDRTDVSCTLLSLEMLA